MTPREGTLLSMINSPADLKNLSDDQLIKLSTELREFIVDVVSVHPGHLGSSLGVVELTIAIHSVFNTPFDRLIWDVGHQAYGHKILTGRRDSFHTNRQLGGIAGFPVRKESEYDAFGTGHASTSVSAALGMAEASNLVGETNRKHIAVIGDGALTGGMAIEGMNNAGSTNADILIILNDNGISIDENVGSLKKYFSKIASTSNSDIKKWRALGIAIKNVDELTKSSTSISGKFERKSNLFEAMNFRYFGPVDGHDVVSLVEALSEIKNIPGPKLLHVITKKGKGFKKAETEQTVYHAPGRFNRVTGDLEAKDDNITATYQEVYGRTLLELAEMNDKLVGITPAMPTGSALTYMKEKYPDRVFDVGIAEQHAVTFAAGLAAEGFKPMCTIYSTFLQRAYDQVIHDVALQKLPVVFCVDRAGLVGEDGSTHHGAYDLAILNTIPGIIISAPMDEVELRNLMFTSMNYMEGPFSIRYPRTRGLLSDWNIPMETLQIGKGRCLIEGSMVAVLSIGHAGNFVAEALKELSESDIYPGHFDMRFLRPIDEDILRHVFNTYESVITVEDGTVVGGLGTAVVEFKNTHNFTNKVQKLGIPHQYIPHGNVDLLHKSCGYDKKGIMESILAMYP